MILADEIRRTAPGINNIEVRPAHKSAMKLV
jgi:hypothetical protein